MKRRFALPIFCLVLGVLLWQPGPLAAQETSRFTPAQRSEFEALLAGALAEGTVGMVLVVDAPATPIKSTEGDSTSQPAPPVHTPYSASVCVSDNHSPHAVPPNLLNSTVLGLTPR